MNQTNYSQELAQYRGQTLMKRNKTGIALEPKVRLGRKLEATTGTIGTRDEDTVDEGRSIKNQKHSTEAADGHNR